MSVWNAIRLIIGLQQKNKQNVHSAQHGITCVACHDSHGFDKLSSVNSGTLDRCGGCHIDSMSFRTFQKRQPHYPCPKGRASCTNCHMPFIGKTGGEFSIRSHTFSVIPPRETVKYGIPNSCQNGKCHGNKSIEWAIREFDKFYSAPRQ